jgi:hypothetical protein
MEEERSQIARNLAPGEVASGRGEIAPGEITSRVQRGETYRERDRERERAQLFNETETRFRILDGAISC